MMIQKNLFQLNQKRSINIFNINRCHKVVDITVENASDVLCALSNYLSAVA